MGAVDFSIDVKLVAAIRETLPIDVFVETGTFEGEAVARLRGEFEELHSIELADDYYNAAAERFGGDEAVRLHHGDSPVVLASLEKVLRERAVLYWLDAHWCAADGTAGEKSQCPLLAELASIGELNERSAILIDDARLFLAPPPAPHEIGDWPRFQQILQRLSALNASHEIMVVNDVIAFFPPAARSAVSEYARAHGIDPLADAHRRFELEQARDTIATVADERLTEIKSLTEVASDRLSSLKALEEEREAVAAVADERLAALNEAASELGVTAEALRKAQDTVDALRQDRDAQATAAAERLALIGELERERDTHAAAAEERLALIGELERERDTHAAAAEERLALIGDLEAERDLQAQTAAERLEALKAAQSESTSRLRALEELAAQRYRAG
jgi:molybdopterin converting factor small subunit